MTQDTSFTLCHVSGVLGLFFHKQFTQLSFPPHKIFIA